MAIENVMKKVLVTGGGGFIGSRLVYALLNKGCRVKVLDIQPGRLKGEENPDLEFVGVGSDELRGGMADRTIVEEAVNDVEVVYHLAINWNGVTWRQAHPLADRFYLNICGTLNLLEASRTHGVKHFLYASSEAVYGKSKSRTVNEESACAPEFFDEEPTPAYGILKLTLEKLCLMYHHSHGLPVTILRIWVVYDDENALLLNSNIMRRVRNEEPIEFVGDEGRTSIHVDEVVQGFLLATLNQNAYGQVFNLANPSTHMSYREMYQLVIESTGSESEIRLKAVPRQISPIPSVESIQTLLGWKPEKTKEDLRKAIVRTVRRS